MPSFGNPALHVAVRFFGGAVISIVVAYLTYQLAERPFMRARKLAHESVTKP